tara:strand:- start:333 stop:638 length:306 start_codon:yes stop_codon:yes gene_type:complete
MSDKSIKGDCSVSLIRENEDGSSDFQFNFPPEALAALTRLGILTAIQAGIGEAECLNPDTSPPKQWVRLTEGEIQDVGVLDIDIESFARAIEARLKEKNND